MANTTLMIMAAGIGSRFGGGIKQLAPVGPCGEIIMDYSVYDAAEAGFDDVIFIIRHDLEQTEDRKKSSETESKKFFRSDMPIRNCRTFRSRFKCRADGKSRGEPDMPCLRQKNWQKIPLQLSMQTIIMEKRLL